MKTDFPDIARASRLSVSLALSTLTSKGFPSESARARVMADRYIEDVRLLLCASPKIRDARALMVVRQAAAFVRRAVLTAELKSRGTTR